MRGEMTFRRPLAVRIRADKLAQWGSLVENARRFGACSFVPNFEACRDESNAHSRTDGAPRRALEQSAELPQAEFEGAQHPGDRPADRSDHVCAEPRA